MTLDLLAREAELDGRRVELSAREFALLAYLMRHPGQVLSRQQILNGVWGYTFDPRSNLVDVYVGYLRRKLDDERPVADRDGARHGLQDGAREGRVRGGLAIRTRLAIVSATLAVGVLAAGLLTVYLIDRRQVDQSLAADARACGARSRRVRPAHGRRCRRNEARERRPPRDRLSPGSGRVGTAAGQHPAERVAPGEQPPRAAVVARTDVPVGGAKRVEIAGEEYVASAARRDGARFVAAVPAAEAEAGVRTLLDAMLIVCLVGLVPATGAAWLVTRRALAPLSRIAQRASRVTAGDLSVRMGSVRSHDEIADVAIAIDAMLDRLEGAFAAQRRFVHDASHELRTPLTIARGHLETALVPGHHPAELDAAVRVAIAELDRMGRLVESLLRLARTGADGRPTREPVDVGELARRVVERSAVLGDRAWSVDAAPERVGRGRRRRHRAGAPEPRLERGTAHGRRASHRACASRPGR